MMRIAYFADGPWSHRAFKLILADKDISIGFVCCRFDSEDETLRRYCLEYGIPLLKNPRVNSAEFIDTVRRYGCDLLVSMSFNQIFRRELMEQFPLKAINCHAGKLPFYRGRNVLNWALINDEKEFGITVHYIDDGIDTGDIISQSTHPITDADSYATLLEKAYTGCAELLYHTIRKFLDGDVQGRPQSEIHPAGFYCSQRRIGDERVRWTQTSRDLFNFVRSICHPGPQARATINGAEMRINRTRMVDGAPTYKCIAGAVLCKDCNGLLVKTGDSSLYLVEYECDGKVRVGDRFDLAD